MENEAAEQREFEAMRAQQALVGLSDEPRRDPWRAMITQAYRAQWPGRRHQLPNLSLLRGVRYGKRRHTGSGLPGHPDAITLPETARVGDGQPAPAQTE